MKILGSYPKTRLRRLRKSSWIRNLISENNISHNVLNAKHHEKEASIIAQAGRLGAVTIATNMAGRGTDIQLGGNLDLRKKETKNLETDFSRVIILKSQSLF